jgi:hypothetical protein
LITNGGFETGLSGWTVTDEFDGGGSWFSQTGTVSPLNGFVVPAPPEGNSAAMTDQTFAGSHSLMQSFVATASSINISFMLFVHNAALDFASPADLDLNDFPNQQARVDLLNASGTAFDLTNVVANLYQTEPGDPLTSGYTLISSTVNGLTVGDTYQLRFAETDNQGFFNLGVDDVNVNAPTATPEPATFVLAGAFLVGIGLIKRKPIVVLRIGRPSSCPRVA